MSSRLSVRAFSSSFIPSRAVLPSASRQVSASAFALSSSCFSTVSSNLCNTRRFSHTKENAEEKKVREELEATLPEAIQEELSKLRIDLKKKTEEAQDFKSKSLYMAAEAENARRIAREDTEKAKNFSVRSFAVDMLEVNDTLERGIDAFGKLKPDEVKFLTEHKLFSQLVTGVKLSHSQMLHNLGRHGVEHIDAEVGQVFDPNKHEAIFNAPESENAKDGEIANIAKKGYMLKERVLRATQVGVAQKQ